MSKNFEALTWGCTVWYTSRLSWQFFSCGSGHVSKIFHPSLDVGGNPIRDGFVMVGVSKILAGYSFIQFDVSC